MSFLADLDRSLFIFLNTLNHHSLNQLMVFISGQWVWGPFLIFIGWQAFKRGTKFTYIFIFFLFLTIIASDATSSLFIKNLVRRLRPCRDLDVKGYIYFFNQKCGGRFGFVSSHAANSMAASLFSYFTLFNKVKWGKLIFIIPLVVSYSRIYLGVHYPGDVLGGYIVGLFWAYLLSKIFNDYQGANL